MIFRVIEALNAEDLEDKLNMFPYCKVIHCFPVIDNMGWRGYTAIIEVQKER